MFICHLSGSVPTEPVITPSGIVYERRLIEEHLATNPNCPVTNEPLKKESLVAVSTKPVNKPTSAVAISTVSALTKGLQNHFDLLLLENQQLRSERDEARHQVTHLMYLRDGATRIIARHLEENEILKEKVAEVQKRTLADSGMEMSDSPPRKIAGSADGQVSAAEYAEATKPLTALGPNLLAARKQRSIVARPPTAFNDFNVETPVHRNEFPGATAFDIFLSSLTEAPTGVRQPHLYAVGMGDGRILVESRVAERTVATLKGHSEAITALKCLTYPNPTHLNTLVLGSLGASNSSPNPFKSCFNILSGSEDETVRLWRETDLTSLAEIDCLTDGTSGGIQAKFVKPNATWPESMSYTCEHVFRLHSGSISDIKLHPCGTLAGAAHGSGWTFFDIVEPRVLKYYSSTPDGLTGCSAIAFQPDGNLCVGAATNKTLPVWDPRTGDLKARPECTGIEGKITAMDFSENGYLVAVGSSCGKGQIWDLRKTVVTQEFEIGHAITSCRFDYAGRHLAFGHGHGLDVYSTVEKKRLEIARHFTDEPVLSLAFDPLEDSYIATLGENGHVKWYRPTN